MAPEARPPWYPPALDRGPGPPPSLAQPFVEGEIKTLAGPVPRVSSTLRLPDVLGAVRVRVGLGRMGYRVDPGLYALGEPGPESPVLVTASYKLSFDHLRRALKGRDAWILVLDTQGINVWCAAGKGAFGTEELVWRAAAARLDKVVSHRTLIVPQLGAPGVSAHAVKRLSGYGVIFGPIRARDLPAFLDAGYRAEPRMRRKGFSLGERAVLIPVELMSVLRYSLLVVPLLFLAGGVQRGEGFWAGAWVHGLFAVFAYLVGVGAGAMITPLSLPWIPGRAFSWKGFLAGLAGALIFMGIKARLGFHGVSGLEEGAWLLMILALSSFLAMNFTGASTFTSLSGVKKEMRRALPLQIAGATAGLGLWLGALLLRA